METGRGKVATKWIGMLEIRCLIKMRRQVRDRVLAFQALSFALIVSNKGRKWRLLGVPNQIGIPRYLSWLEDSLMSRMELILFSF